MKSFLLINYRDVKDVILTSDWLENAFWPGMDRDLNQYKRPELSGTEIYINKKVHD